LFARADKTKIVCPGYIPWGDRDGIADESLLRDA